MENIQERGEKNRSKTRARPMEDARKRVPATTEGKEMADGAARRWSRAARTLERSRGRRKTQSRSRTSSLGTRSFFYCDSWCDAGNDESEICEKNVLFWFSGFSDFLAMDAWFSTFESHRNDEWSVKQGHFQRVKRIIRTNEKPRILRDCLQM